MTRLRSFWFPLAICSCFVFSPRFAIHSVFAEDPREAEQLSADEQTIRNNVQTFTEAFNKGDSEALAALWEPQGEYIAPATGERLQGREAIARHFARIFAQGAPGRLAVDIQSIRFVTPNVAIEEGKATVARANGEPVQTTYTAVHVRNKKDWLLDSIRESVLPPEPSSHEHLQALAWLVGEWVDADAEHSIHTTTRWADNGAFLVQSFAIVVEGNVEMRGMQIIGWDPAKKQIRSWAFDSDGGFSEGVWREQGGRWVVRASNTLANGKTGSAINTYRPIDENHFAWKSSARQVDGHFLPNVDEVVVARVAE